MSIVVENNFLFGEVSQLIEAAKNQVAQKVNSSLVLLHWQIGSRINKAILDNKRAGYGERIVKQLAALLSQQYGRGFNERSLFRMVRFTKQFPDIEIVVTLSPLLSWSHFIELIAFDDLLKRNFYTEMCRIEHWSVRELRQKIDGMLYERTSISKNTRALN